MKNGSFIALHDKYQFRYLFKYPARYIIQLDAGAKKDHCTIFLWDHILEFKFGGVVITRKSEWFARLDKQTVLSVYEPINELTEREISQAYDYIKRLIASGNTKYSVLEYVLSKIPVLKKIRFKEDKYMYCDKFYLRILQEIGRLPKDVYCGQYNVDDIPDLLCKHNFISGDQKLWQ